MALNNGGRTLCVYTGKTGSTGASCVFVSPINKMLARDDFLDSGFNDNISGAFISPLDQSLTINPVNEDQLENYAQSVISEIQNGLITTIDPSGIMSTTEIPKEVFTAFASRPADMHEYLDSTFAEYRWNTNHSGKLVQLRVQIQKTSSVSDITYVFMINESPMFGAWFALSELCIQSTKTVKIRHDAFPVSFYEIGDTLPFAYPLNVVAKTGNSLTMTTVASYPQFT